MPKKVFDYEAGARSWMIEHSYYDALLAAGFSKSVARNGWKALPKSTQDKLLGAIEKVSRKAMSANEKLSRAANNEALSHMARGALIQNVAERTDSGIQSIKAMGNLRGVELFTPENATGVIILQMPPGGIPSFDSVPGLNAEQLLPADTFAIHKREEAE